MTGLRVIDLTRVLGGPYCTQILADHGADVVKVEPPAGDEVRDWGPPFHDEDAAYFVGINRNKRSIGLDLASEGGRIVLMKMLESADVLLMGDDLARLPGALALARSARRIIRQNLAFAFAVMITLMILAIIGDIALPLGVVGHEGSTLIVVANGLRLLIKRW